MILSIFLVISGLIILIVGGESLVRGAAALARSMGISPIVVGMTVVAAGTSAPELVVSVMAALRDNSAICAGNVVGSNIFNILLILGAAAVCCPLPTQTSFIRREMPVVVGISLLLLLLVLDGVIGHVDALILLAVLVGYTVLSIHLARREAAMLIPEFEAQQAEYGTPRRGFQVLLILIGLIGLGGGSELFLRGAVSIAKELGISDVVIGLTLVAFGTSLPELVASVIAAIRRQPDICLGNIVGSNVFNIAAILGVSGLLRELPFDEELLWIHLPVMLGATVLLWPMVTTGLILSRREGAVLLGGFAVYLSWLVYHQV